MPSILALDQGTTGSTALVVHQDGAVIGRGYREFTQHYPQPGWVEHDPEEIFRVSVDVMREALERSRERPVGLGITNQRETAVLWDRRTLAPIGPAIVWQDRRTAGRCRELRESGVETMLRKRTGLVADPYFTATKLEWMLRDAAVRRRADKGELAAGTVESWLVAKLTNGDRACHRPHERVANAPLQSRDAVLGLRAALHLQRAPRAPGRHRSVGRRRGRNGQGAHRHLPADRGTCRRSAVGTVRSGVLRRWSREEHVRNRRFPAGLHRPALTHP